MADGGGGVHCRVKELFFVDCAGRELAARTPDDGARSDEVAIVPAIQHRPARQDDGGNVDRRGGHQGRGRGLVAAGRQHDAVEWIAVEDFDQAEIGKVAVEGGRRALAVFEDRMGGKLDGNASGIADAVAHTPGKIDVMAIARREIAAALGDADHRLARAQLLRRDAVVHEAFEIDGGHVDVVAVIEPILRAQPAFCRLCVRHHDPPPHRPYCFIAGDGDQPAVRG